MVGRANELSFDKSDVEDGSVIVDELEEVNLKSEGVIEAGLGAVELLLGQPHRQPLVQVVEDEDQHQIDAGSGHRDEQTPVTPVQKY